MAASLCPLLRLVLTIQLSLSLRFCLVVLLLRALPVYVDYIGRRFSTSSATDMFMCVLVDAADDQEAE